MPYVTENYFERGGHRIVVGGALAVEAGGRIEVQAGGEIEVKGRLVMNGVMDRAGAVELPAATLDTALVQHYHIEPDAVSAVAVLAATALTADAEGQDITEGITNPDVPRNVTVKGNAAGITGDVVITGTSIDDAVISETIALDGANEKAGALAFKTVTEIHLPPETNAGTDTVSVGIGGIIGLPHILLAAGCMLKSLFNLAADAGTTAVSADIEGNTYDPAGVMDGTKPLDLWYLV